MNSNLQESYKFRVVSGNADNPGRETSISNFQGGNVQNPIGKLVIITRATIGSKMRYKEMVATRTIKLFTEMGPLS